MSDVSTTHRVLVPFELPDAVPVPPALVERLATMEVVVVGHYGLPEQTPSWAGREEFEDEAAEELDDLVADFEAAGGSVTSRLVFGGDRRSVVDDVALAEACDAVLIPGEADAVDQVLVALRDDRNVDRILPFVVDLLGTDASVTLFHSAEGDRQEGAALLETAADLLVEAGVGRDRIDCRVSDGGGPGGGEPGDGGPGDDGERAADDRGGPGTEVAETGAGFDLLVLGETEPSLMERIVGETPARVVRETDRPALVVRDPETG